MLNIAVILPAAGQSRRFNAGPGPGGDPKTSKLSAEVSRKAVLVRAVELFARRPQVRQVIVAADPDHLESFRFRWAEKLGAFGVNVVAGGRKERWETVLNAIHAVEGDITHIAVHDAARPVTDPAMIDRVFEAAKDHPAVIPALPLRETVKRIEGEPLRAPGDPLDGILGGEGKPTDLHRVIETVPRAGLWTIQTPQIFERKLLERAYKQITDGLLDGSKITDDAGLVEALGETVVAVRGDPLNVKVTFPEDLRFAEAVAAIRGGRIGGTEDTLGPKRKHPTWAQMVEE